jgi:hypothetical protein
MKRFGVGAVGARSLHRVASGLLLSSLVGCGAHGNKNDHAGPGSDAGTGAGYPAEGAGGATPSPSSEGGGPGGGKSGNGGQATSDGSTGRLTEEEWARLTGPLEGEHTVVTHASFGCPARRIEQEYRIVPTVACALSPDYDFETNRVRNCTLQPGCSTHDHCREKPFGWCRGSAFATCTYPSVERPLCTLDSECVSLPGGSCPRVINQDIRCYPTGRCEEPERHCYYREEQCSSDADCTSAPGGVCQKRIHFARCEYQNCFADSDCEGGKRCACSSSRNVCVPASCSADADCGAGQECRLETGCFEGPMGYHCSTSADSCRSREDCGGDHCVFDAHWQCRPKPCPIPP